MKKGRNIKLIAIILSISLIIAISGFLLSFFIGYEIHHDVRYGDTEANLMDLYVPRRAYGGEGCGAVMVIHGGSWSGGDKAEEEIRCRMLASRGYLVASVNYTLWSEESKDNYSVFDVLDELDTAMNRINEYAKEQGIKIKKSAVAGYSAGAHLAMLYSFARSEDSPIEIAFTASMAVPADISPEVWGEDMAIRVAKRLTGVEITEEMLISGEAEEIFASISPVSYINENSPPAVMIHGRKDTLVSPKNTESVIKELKKYGVACDCIYLNNSDHSLLQDPIGHIKYYKTVLDYCKLYLK